MSIVWSGPKAFGPPFLTSVSIIVHPRNVSTPHITCTVCSAKALLCKLCVGSSFKNYLLYPLPYLRRWPESKISTEHQASLGLNRGDRAKDKGYRDHNPLKHHEKIFMAADGQGLGRQKVQGEINRGDDPKHSKTHYPLSKTWNIVGDNRSRKKSPAQKDRQPSHKKNHQRICRPRPPAFELM